MAMNGVGEAQHSACHASFRRFTALDSGPLHAVAETRLRAVASAYSLTGSTSTSPVELSARIE